ncbi:MAG: hypothetical protein WCI12_09140, partial [Actinomycetes bacterium]
IYYVVTFVHSNGMPFSTTEADSLNQWFWGADVVTLVLVGWLSDRLDVRKPFMLLGTLMGIVFTFLFLTQANHPHASFRILAFLSVMIATSLSLVFAPWVAGFTEMVEAKNPALVAHGLAMWGGVQRVVVAVVFLLLPVALPSVNAVIDNQAVATAAMPQCTLAPATRVLPAIPGPRVPLGTTAVNFQVLHPDSVVFAQRHSVLLKKVVANYRVINAANAPDAPPAALMAAAAVMGPKDTATLLGLKGEFNSLVAPYACQLNYLAANEVALSKAQEGVKESPLQWQTWFWMCIGGMVAFIPLIFLTKGRWSPKKARGDFEAGEREVDAELEKLTKTQG